MKRDRAFLLEHMADAKDLAPDCGINLCIDSGTSGLAYTAWILGRRDDDREMLTAAYDLLLAKSGSVALPASFALEEGTLHADDVRPFFHRSVIFGEPGLWFVLALSASSVGDGKTASAAAKRFAELCRSPYPFGEFHFGSAGALWASAVLLGCELPADARAEIVTLAQDLMTAAWSQYHGDEQTRSIFALGEYGFAHGRAGILFAILRGSRALGVEPPAGVRGALEALALRGAITPRGISWPICDAPVPPPAAGVAESWCNGAAGFVPLWDLAYETYREDVFRRLAIKAACFITGNTQGARRSVCCGWAGHQIAYTIAGKLEPEGNWSAFVGQIAVLLDSGAAPLTPENHGLLKGEAGELLGGTPWL